MTTFGMMKNFQIAQSVSAIGLLSKAVYAFLNTVDILVQRFFGSKTIKLPSYWGVECGAVSAALDVLQDMVEIYHTVYHNVVGGKDVFTMILHRNLVTDINPPIIINFRDTRDRISPEFFHTGDMNYLSEMAIYGFVHFDVNRMYTARLLTTQAATTTVSAVKIQKGQDFVEKILGMTAGGRSNGKNLSDLGSKTSIC